MGLVGETGGSRQGTNYDRDVESSGGALETELQNPPPARTTSTSERRKLLKHSPSGINGYLNDLSKDIRPEHDHYNVEAERLSCAMRDAGRHAIGVIAAIVWVFDPHTGRIVTPEGGWWRCERFVPSDSNALRRLEDRYHPHHVPAVPTMPGVDVAGELWARSSQPSRQQNQAPNSARSREGLTLLQRMNSFSSLGPPEEEEEESFTENEAIDNDLAMSGRRHPYKSTMVWRDLQSLLDDPDTAKGPRLELLVRSGIGKAASAPFDFSGHQGMVIYFARSTTSTSILTRVENEECMLRSANVVGSMIAATYAQRACLATKAKIRRGAREKLKRSLRMSRTNAKDMVQSTNRRDDESAHKSTATSISRDSRLDEKHHGWWPRTWHAALVKVTTYGRKFIGGHLQVPPALSWHQSILTWVGCFSGLLVLSAFNEYAISLSDGQYELLLGPFGALMTLQYSLSSAPASQPRNVILGQATAGAVSLAITYIPDYVVSKWVRRALAPAFAIATMTKLGVTHPPAGAHSVIYSSGDYDWMFYFLVVLASIVSVIPAVLINNLSKKRQYPTYWINEEWFASMKEKVAGPST